MFERVRSGEEDLHAVAEGCLSLLRELITRSTAPPSGAGGARCRGNRSRKGCRSYGGAPLGVSAPKRLLDGAGRRSLSEGLRGAFPLLLETDAYSLVQVCRGGPSKEKRFLRVCVAVRCCCCDRRVFFSNVGVHIVSVGPVGVCGGVHGTDRERLVQAVGSSPGLELCHEQTKPKKHAIILSSPFDPCDTAHPEHLRWCTRWPSPPPFLFQDGCSTLEQFVSAFGSDIANNADETGDRTARIHDEAATAPAGQHWSESPSRDSTTAAIATSGSWNDGSESGGSVMHGAGREVGGERPVQDGGGETALSLVLAFLARVMAPGAHEASALRTGGNLIFFSEKLQNVSVFFFFNWDVRFAQKRGVCGETLCMIDRLFVSHCRLHAIYSRRVHRETCCRPYVCFPSPPSFILVGGVAFFLRLGVGGADIRAPSEPGTRDRAIPAVRYLRQT